LPDTGATDFTQLGEQLPNLLIEKPTKDLLNDFKAATSRRPGLCEYAVPPSVNAPKSKGVEVVFTYPQEDVRILSEYSPLDHALTSYLKEPACLPSSDIPNIPVILSLHSVLPTSSSSVPQTIGTLTRILRHLAATQNVETTLLILPSKLAKSSPKKHAHNARSNPEETPFDLPSKSTPNVASSTPSTYTTLPLPSAIPACFASLDACTNTTNACSNHGKCYEAHNKCFRCKCHPTILKEYDDGSKKTIIWGGGACEKKDVSVPFMLFAGFGVIFTMLIAGIIGMMYSMGSADLPKVLSAGVGGAKPPK
jgi:Domain of unknown function (DUF3844)